MILMIVLILIALSIASESASQMIYFLKIRGNLPRSYKMSSFDWLPQKRKANVAEYIKKANGIENVLIWGKIVIWLYYISWIFLLISALLTIFIVTV